MGWSVPEISLEDLLKLIKGFVDILILASGYQSSGLNAQWDPHNIKKALQWGLFFETVCKLLTSLEDPDSMNELDGALSELKSNPSFPQGLSHISYVTLSRARYFVLEHLIHTIPLRDAHLESLLNAIIAVDLDDISNVENDSLFFYLNKLKLLHTSLSQSPSKLDFVGDSMIASLDFDPNIKFERYSGCVLTNLTLHELLKRELAVSCVSSVESGLDIISSVVRNGISNESYSKVSKEKLKNDDNSLRDDQFIKCITWDSWKSKNLSYLLEKNTIRLVSGANMIFSAPRIQWIQVFRHMDITPESSIDDFTETIELFLLGCIASRWTQIIEHFMSIPFISLTISDQYLELCNLLRRSQLSYSKNFVNSNESDILEYLAEFLAGQFHHLWKLSPLLVAASISSWSPLFGLYMSEIDAQLKGEASAHRCDCAQVSKEHKECELAERIWCLYLFHIRGSHLLLGTTCS